MKTITLFLMVSLISCLKNIGIEKIDVAEIEIVEIKKNLSDTLSVQLNKTEYIKFAEIVNSNAPGGLRKAKPKYWLSIKYKNNSIQSYKIIDNYIGQGDFYMKSNDLDYFKDLYELGKKEKHKIAIKQTTPKINQ